MYRKIDINVILSEAKNLFFKFFCLKSNIQYLKTLSLLGRAFFFTTCFLLLTTPSAAQQNLVPNYSFEDTIQCPQHDNQFFGYVKNWTGQETGLCYFNSKCSGFGVEVPTNEFGSQYPHTGFAYGGIYTFINASHDGGDSATYYYYHNFRDYMQDSLQSPLIGGKKYYVTFYVSLADSFKYACNNIGAYFSDSSLIFTGKVKSYLHPQVSNDTAHNPLTSKVNWTKVSGSFMATGGEQYIIIGNFVDDAHVDTVFVGSNASFNDFFATYYYIDDVIVSTDSTYADSLFTGINELKRSDVSANVYPNPASTLLNVAVNMSQIKSGSICLYSATGEEVKCEDLTGNITSIAINNLPAGLYYYRITDAEGNLVKADKVVIVK